MNYEYDLVITGVKLVNSQQVFPATVVIRGEQIVGILSPEEKPPAKQMIDVDGLTMLPGIIDTHVHLRDPGKPAREDFLSGTSAAASAGITTMMEMPISEPPVYTAEILAQRAKTIQPRAIIDYALYACAGTENIDHIAGLAEAGAIAFKTFMTGADKGREHEFTGLTCTDTGILYEVMQETAKTGLRHCFHAEDWEMVKALEKKLRDAGRVDPYAHIESRPPIVEDVAVANILAIAQETGTPVGIVHISSPRAVEMAQEARKRGVDVTIETCPQYLCLTDEALNQYGVFAKCNPALRPAELVEELWTYINSGTIDVMGSDHSPFLTEEKERGLENIFEAPSGIPGLETLLPLMLDSVHHGRLTIQQLVGLMSERPAQIFRLPNKGFLRPGYDADFVLVDLESSWLFDRHQCYSKAKDNMRAHHGKEFHGEIVSTWLRGQKIAERKKVLVDGGYGRFIRPHI